MTHLNKPILEVGDKVKFHGRICKVYQVHKPIGFAQEGPVYDFELNGVKEEELYGHTDNTCNRGNQGEKKEHS